MPQETLGEPRRPSPNPFVDKDIIQGSMYTYIPLEKKRVAELVARFKEPLLRGNTSLLEPFSLEEAVELFGLSFFAAAGQALQRDEKQGLSWYITNTHAAGIPLETVVCQQQTPPRILMLIDRRGIVEIGDKKLAQETSIWIDDPTRGEFEVNINLSPDTMQIKARLNNFLLKSGKRTTSSISGVFTHEGKNAIPPYQRIPLSR